MASPHLGSDADLAAFRTLHTASLASPELREGVNPESLHRTGGARSPAQAPKAPAITEDSSTDDVRP